MAEKAITPAEREVEASPPAEKADGFGSSNLDQIEMQRMGKDQEMNRIFHQVSLLSYTTILMGTWQWMLMANTQALTCGGRGGLFWSYIWTFFGYALLAASLADMASMAPTAGGQYHWVSEFAPRKYQQVLSYASGWLSVICWQAGNASGLFLCGVLIQSLATINYPDYPAPAWQGWLLVVAVTCIVTFFNIWGEPILPHMQNAFAPVYVAAFLATVGVLAGMGSHVDAKTAFLEFTDLGGWNSMGLAVLIGQISAVFALGGSDAAAHMAEEVQGAGVSVPRAMVWTVLGNGLMGFAALIAFIFSIGSVEDAVNDPSGFPLIYALNNSGGPKATLALIFLQFILLMVGNVGYQASVGRQTFAFARDGGMPFSSWIGHVNPKHHLPVNAILLSACISIILSVINIGSSDAFNAIISLAAVGQMGTYSISITCVLYRRLTAPHTLPTAQWGLGRWGIPVNTGAAAYAWFVFFFAFWPDSTPVAADSMNYAVVMFGGVVLISLVYYFVKARRDYKGPVTKTEGWPER